MGGVGTSLSIEAVSPPAGKSRSSPLALHKAITRLIKDWFKRRPFMQVFVGELRDVIADGYRDEVFAATSSELTWIFRDYGGTWGGSAQLSLHCCELLMSKQRDNLDGLAARRGWRVTSPRRSPHAVMLEVCFPLGRTPERTPMYVPPFALGELGWGGRSSGPFFDDGPIELDLAALSRSEQRGIARAAIAGRCACSVCSAIAYSRLSPTPVLEACWQRIGRSEALIALSSRVVDELRYGDWKPPAAPGALGELVAELGVSKLQVIDAARIAFRVDLVQRRQKR